ncbi:hypothetical protein C8J56DRAFT_1057174 [Mycena floridula]|nr:hypothetical protein C8J56DRAFT_1057174 [Mycena floridula]
MFTCRCCSQNILPNLPRVHCSSCSVGNGVTFLDLCANCALGDRFPDGHSATHQTTLFKFSGGDTVPATVSERLVLTCSPSEHRSPPPFQAPGPPPPLPPRPHRNTQSFSRSSSQPVEPNFVAPESTNSVANGWGPFFQPDMTPNPAFIAMMDAIFRYLDSTSNGGPLTGYLSPEAYSRFLDDQGYLNSHTGKSNLTPDIVYGKAKEDVADQALRNAYDLFSIEHILKPRNSPVTPSPFAAQYAKILGPALAASLAANSAQKSPTGGMMPLLTMKGFVDITAVEALCDPGRHWGCFSRIVKQYNILQSWGPIPRTVLPEVAEPMMLSRVETITTFSKARGERQLEAARVQAELQARGRQNALDLISDTHYVYRYY